MSSWQRGEVAERTSYEITDDGEADFLRLLRGALNHGGDDHALLCAGVTLMPRLPRAEVIELLRERLAVLNKSDAEVVVAIDANEAEWGKPAHVRVLFGGGARGGTALLGWAMAVGMALVALAVGARSMRRLSA